MTAAREILRDPTPQVDPVALESLMCRAGLAVAVLDATGRLSMLSPHLEHLLQHGFTPVPMESLATEFHLYSEGGDRQLRPQEVPIVRAWRGEVVDDVVVTVRAPGQPVRHLRVNATPIIGPHGERQGAWAVATDVTCTVAAARGELRRDLAETVNHNLRTPLTTMMCHAEGLLDQQDDLSPGTTRSLQALWRAGRRLQDVVTSISEWIDLAQRSQRDGDGADVVELALILRDAATSDTFPRDRPAAPSAGTGTPSPGGAVVLPGGVDLTSAVNLVGDGLLALGPDGQVRYVNDAAARLLDREVSDAHGRDVWRMLPPDVGPVLADRCREALRSQRPVELEQHVKTLGAWFSVRIHPLPDGVCVVLRDVTGLRSLLAERRGFAERLLAAQERERARIAADVHEDSLQALGAVAVHLHLLRALLGSPPARVHSLLDALEEQVAGATDRLRALLFSLEPAPAGIPISQCIRTQAAQLLHGSSVRWSVDDADGCQELTQAERTQVLRITKEALSNVLAHARATEVVVTLHGDEAGVEIKISDNGVAADPADLTSAPGHRGLQTMRDRAAEVGGRCTIEPTTPHGCTVRLFLPRVRAW